MKLCIFSCTAKKDEKNTLLYQSCLEFNDLDLFFKKENIDGLSKSYNTFLYSKVSEEYDTILFVHDDVYIDDLKLEKKLTKAFESYDIVGLAGCVNPKITKPALWHLMAGGFGSGNLHGIVNHYTDQTNTAYHPTFFGTTPARVAVLDGLFLALNVKKVKEKNWKFNENYKFHHYDIASSIDANAKKLKLGVYPIHVIHSSPGLMSFDKKFTDSEECFLKEYSH